MIRHNSSSADALRGFLSTAVFSPPSVLRDTREAGQTTLRRLVSFSGNKWSGATSPIRTCRKATGCLPTGNKLGSLASSVLTRTTQQFGKSDGAKILWPEYSVSQASFPFSRPVELTVTFVVVQYHQTECPTKDHSLQP